MPPGIRVYNTSYGAEDPDKSNEFTYRSSSSYNTGGGAYHANNGGDIKFINPNTFQLFTFGSDGLAAPVPLDDSTTDEDSDGVPDSLANQDNITNFANGRLEAFDWRENLGL